jgi:glutathione S-transferase
VSIVLYHHPFSRASGTLWMLEEVGVDYELRWVDIRAGEQKKPELVKLNPMGKLPTLVDGDTVVTENAAIGLYLADRYALGKLAPKPDDPQRGTYLRWSCFSPSVVEPGLMAKMNGWQADPGTVGWGTYEAMLDAMESAIGEGPFILGERFSMADVIFGGTLRYMLRFKTIEARPKFVAYSDRISERPASKRADAKNGAIIQEHGLAS